MRISWKRFVRELGPTIEHLSEHPERDMADLFAVLTGESSGEVKLRVANEILQGHGVEAIHDERADDHRYWGDIIADYVNMGDTYTLTIVRSRDGNMHITSWGDYYEHWERKLPRKLQNMFG